jgi:amino acid transporter
MTTAPPETAQATPRGTNDKGLKRGAIGLAGSVVVGMASTAPAYSLAASLGLVVAAGAGLKAPAIMLLAFIPMYFIAVAYKELNEAEPDCGTTFTWATRAFGPVAGWMGGWGIIVADVIVMANLAQIAGTYSFQLANELGLKNDLADSTLWTTVAGLGWIAIMTYICYRGIEVSARLQIGLLGLEIVTLGLFVVTALYRVFTGSAGDQAVKPSLSWLWPSGMSPTEVIAPAVLTAVFIYWGWDTAVSTNEETQDPGRTPGRAAVISTVLLLITYVLVSVAAVSFAGVGTDGIGLGNPDNAADVFNAIGPSLFGDSLIGKIGMGLLSVSILTSASASTQTTILPTARTALSMAAYRAFPKRFATIHPRFLTPSWSTVGMGLVSMAFFLLMTWISPSILMALIGAIGLQIAFYYGLTGIACAWFYRRTLTSSPRHFVTRGLIPLLGGVSLFLMFIYATQVYARPDNLQDADGNNVTLFGLGAVAVVGIGSLLSGLVLMAVQWAVSPAFFQGKTLPRASSGDLLLEGERYAPHIELLPDSFEAMVIAPDLSNLPRGARAVDPETGRLYDADNPPTLPLPSSGNKGE